jgi:release factor glutamine methyltransferase
MKKRDSCPGMSNDDTITWREMLSSTSEIVGDRTIAKWLCQHAAGVDSGEWINVLDEKVTQRCGLHLDSMLRRYVSGEPLQYVLGRWSFRHLDLMVDQRVLIPRPETEELVDIVLSFLREMPEASGRSHTIIDLGSGSGAIGLSLLHELPRGSAQVWLTDASTDAIDVLRANLAGIGRAAMSGNVVMGSWYDALPVKLQGAVDVIVSNPPYIAFDDQEVEAKVREWEPRIALFAEQNGLADIATIVTGAKRWLRPGGLLALEIGYEQARHVCELCEQHGLTNVTVRQDAAGRNRFVTAVAMFVE